MQASIARTRCSITGGVVSWVDFERCHTGLGQGFAHITTRGLPYLDEREFRLLLWKHELANVTLATAGGGVLTAIELEKRYRFGYCLRLY